MQSIHSNEEELKTIICYFRKKDMICKGLILFDPTTKDFNISTIYLFIILSSMKFKTLIMNLIFVYILKSTQTYHQGISPFLYNKIYKII